MTLLLRSIGGWLVDSILWLLVIAALSTVAAAAASDIIDRRPPDRILIGWAAFGAILLASTAHRLDITSWLLEVGSRDLPVVSAVVGALVAASVAVMVSRRKTA